MTLLEFNKFISDGSVFLENLIIELLKKSIDIENIKCDHLCFRVDSIENYQLFSNGLSNYGELLTESMVNGRPICIFRLNARFKFRNFETSIVELPAPKIGSPYKTGFEHAEFVISEDLNSFAHKYSHLNFSIIKKNSNSELLLPMSCGQVKFHRISLERIIEIEKSKITDVIFDFDGTLINSRDAIYEINRQLDQRMMKT